MKTPNHFVTLSRELLLHVKLNKDTTVQEQQLRTISFVDLQQQLHTDDAKKAFWINIYNAYCQLLSNSEKTKKKTIFTDKLIQIAQHNFSLDDIEHGILRKYRWKWSLGYLKNPFVSTLIKTLAVNELDYRIHFALNCGAKSCPPIFFYTLERINEELNGAMKSFLVYETTIDEDRKSVSTSKLLYWYRGDFGGIVGIKKVLNQTLEKDFKTFNLYFDNYNWETQLKNYITN